MSDRSVHRSQLPRQAVGTSKILTVGRATLQCFDAGAGETVVLLPGFGRAASDYNELVQALNQAGYRTVALELRGVGASRSPFWPRATLQDFAADVAGVVRELGGIPGGKVHVLGRAFGSRVARAVAVHYPHLVRSVILLAAGGLVLPSFWVYWRYGLLASRVSPPFLRRWIVQQTLYAPGNRPPHYLVYGGSWRALSRQAYAARRSPLETWWHGGQAPMLVVHGQEDRLAPLANATASRDRFPERVQLVVVPHAGHALLPEQPGLVTDAVLRFLKEHPIAALPARDPLRNE
jgi:pimeloyl-ACP methyl ester carboxylesterase